MFDIEEPSTLRTLKAPLRMTGALLASDWILYILSQTTHHQVLQLMVK